jgi:hypothetical protein
MPDDLRSCPICWARFNRNGRRVYCTDQCRKTAYQRRQRHTADLVPARADTAAPAPVDERACPYCGNPITVITLLATPQAARPQLPAPGTPFAPAAATVTAMPEQQTHRLERLDQADANEIAETLAFLRHWMRGHDHDLLADSLRRFVGVDGYDLTTLQTDLARFAFLLGDLTDEPDDEQQPTTHHNRDDSRIPPEGYPFRE